MYSGKVNDETSNRALNAKKNERRKGDLAKTTQQLIDFRQNSAPTGFIGNLLIQQIIDIQLQQRHQKHVDNSKVCQLLSLCLRMPAT